MRPFKWKQARSSFTWYCLLLLYMVVPILMFVHKLMFSNSPKIYWIVCHVALFIVLYKVAPMFCFWTNPLWVTIQMKAIEQYLHVAVWLILNKVVLTEHCKVGKVASWPNPAEIICKNKFLRSSPRQFQTPVSWTDLFSSFREPLFLQNKTLQKPAKTWNKISSNWYP